MAAAASFRTGHPASARGVKGSFLIFSLLCLICVTSSLNTENQLEKMKAAIKELQRWKAEDKHRSATITKLFDLSSSLTNKDQLEIFEETLRKAVKEEERVKAEYKYKITKGSREFEEQMTQLILHLERLKTLSHDSPPLREILKISMRLLKNIRTYLDKKAALLQEQRTQKRN